jgi:FlaG/FlaF family flagellin (archaellin)
VYRNGSLTGDSGSWTNADNITINIDGLTKGVYNYTIAILDVSGNQGTDTVIVTVVDKTPPLFVVIPTDLQYSEGTIGHTLSWNTTDNYPNNYQVFSNGTFTGDSGAWDNLNLITINIDGLAKGVYNYTIIVSDISGNIAFNTVIVSVLDTTSPIFVSIPSDLQYSEGSSGNTRSWIATDNYPATYEVYRNGSFTGDTGSWTSAVFITINIDGLAKGVYNYTIVVSDTSGNEVGDTVIITVVDTTSPSLVSVPADLQYSESSTGNTLSWNATDNHPATFDVYRNGSFTGDTGSWTNVDIITINVDGLLQGVYNYTIVVTDVSGNEASNTVIVKVFDSTPPIFVSTPSDLQYLEETTSHFLSWNTTDNVPGTYEVYRNGSFTGDSGSWTNADNITINVDGLAKGIYNYTIFITDQSGNQVSDNVIVTVLDIVSPIFDITPADLQYSEGTTGNILSWNVTDNHPETFELYRNGSFTGDTGSWTNADNITINVDGLGKGVYNYTIVVSDDSGNQVSDTVIVTVVDTTPPYFVSIPTDLQYSEGITGNTLSWNATDTYPATFEVYRNGIRVYIIIQLSLLIFQEMKQVML